MLLTLASASLRRHRVRTALAVLGVAVSAALLSLLLTALAVPIAFRVRLMRRQRLLTTILVVPITLGTVLVAAGYRPHHPWLRLPVTAPDGTIRQHRGVTPAEGVYVVGQRFQHRRDSGQINGARHDARSVVTHLLATSGSPVPALAGSTSGRREPAA